MPISGVSTTTITVASGSAYSISFYGTGSDNSFLNGPSGNSLGINSGTGGGSYRTRVFLTNSQGHLSSIDAGTGHATATPGADSTPNVRASSMVSSTRAGAIG